MRSPESSLASLAVISFRIISTVVAHSTTLVVHRQIHTLLVSINIFVVETSLRVSVAVASLALVRVSRSSRSPFFLNVIRRALVAVSPRRVVLTLAVVLAIFFHAVVRVAIAHASAADFDVLDCVEIALEDFWVVVAGGHEVTVVSVDFEKTDSDLRGSGEFLELV